MEPRDKIMKMLDKYTGKPRAALPKSDICDFLEGYYADIKKVMDEQIDKDRIIKDIKDTVEKIEGADSCLVAITYKKGNKCVNYQAFINFPLPDFVKTLNKHAQIVPTSALGNNRKVTGIKA